MKAFANQEDTRKLHAEINQFSNQRVLLLTLSITIFAALTGATIPKDVAKDQSNVIIAVFIVMQIFIFMLSILASTLRHITRCEATYLIETGATRWEEPWREFRERYGYAGLASVENVVFYILTLLAAVLPLTFSILFWTLSYRHFLPVITAAILIFLMNRQRNMFRSKEKLAQSVWRTILKGKRKKPEEEAA